MAIAAVPDYIGKALGNPTAEEMPSPQLGFGMYLCAWESGWTKAKSATGDLKRIIKLSRHMKELQDGHCVRHRELASRVVPAQCLHAEAIATAPFSTGLGNEHPLENGFAFLTPYGLPYLAGSGVKGVLRAAARELASAEFGDTKGWTEESIHALFGYAGSDHDDANGRRGALQFWDVLPQLAGNTMAVEIMTPHQSHYIQGRESPHDAGQPNPILFLAVPPNSKFEFLIQCDLPFLESSSPFLAADARWKALMQAALEHAFEWLGFGAKTAVGYGAMQVDVGAKRAREGRERQQQEAQRIASLSPEKREWEEHRPNIDAFRDVFGAAKAKGSYQAGQQFDDARRKFVAAAETWTNQRSRNEAAALLEETIKYGASKKGKEELKAAAVRLRGKDT